MAKIELYKFQHECVDKLGVPELISRLVGDDMGLGKTFEAIVIDMRLRVKTKEKVLSHVPSFSFPVRRTLILAPLSVHGHWAKHIKALWPQARVYVMDREGTPAQGRAAFRSALKQNYNYYICHYEAVRNKDLLPDIRKVDWFHVIADECHRLKGRKTQQTRAVKTVRARFKTGLSGTPAEDKPQDLWSPLNWLWPNVYRSFWKFVGDYCEQETTCQECGGTSMGEDGPIIHTSRCTKQGTTFKKIVGVKKEAIPALRREMSRYTVRRLKTDPGILDELPPKTYTDIEVELSPRQRKAYNQMRKNMLAWIGEHEDQPLTAAVVVAQLCRLQQFALASAHIEMVPVKRRGTRQVELVRTVILEEPSSKLAALEELIDDHPNEQFVVFSQFRSMADLTAQKLESKGITVGLYTGAVRDQGIRDKIVDEFQGGNIQVFVGTIAAGGESITLHRSSTCVLFDRHWTPTKNEQAVDRLHRDGQRHPVQVIDIIAKNTVDIGRRTKIAAKWSTLKMLLDENVDMDAYEEEVEHGS